MRSLFVMLSLSISVSLVAAEVKPQFVRDAVGVRSYASAPRLAERLAIPPAITLGVATEVGIEPTARHGSDLGYIPVLITDACGAGNEEAAKRSIESLKFGGDTLVSATETICAILRQRSGLSRS